jgi:hypothetical protein
MEPRLDDTVASRVGDVVEGYAALASSLLDRWGTHSSKMAEKVSGEYDAASAAEDLTTCATLATEGGLQLAAEAVGAFVTLTGIRSGQSTANSQTFHAPAGAALTLDEALINGPGHASIAPSAVTIEPAQLAPADTEFRISVDTTRCRGATYYGKVTATTAAGSEDVWVWVTVP